MGPEIKRRSALPPRPHARGACLDRPIRTTACGLLVNFCASSLSMRIVSGGAPKHTRPSCLDHHLPTPHANPSFLLASSVGSAKTQAAAAAARPAAALRKTSPIAPRGLVIAPLPGSLRRCRHCLIPKLKRTWRGLGMAPLNSSVCPLSAPGSIGSRGFALAPGWRALVCPKSPPGLPRS